MRLGFGGGSVAKLVLLGGLVVQKRFFLSFERIRIKKCNLPPLEVLQVIIYTYNVIGVAIFSSLLRYQED